MALKCINLSLWFSIAKPNILDLCSILSLLHDFTESFSLTEHVNFICVVISLAILPFLLVLKR